MTGAPMRVIDPLFGASDLPGKAPTALTVIEAVPDYVESEIDGILDYAHAHPERTAEIVCKAHAALKTLTASLLGVQLTRQAHPSAAKRPFPYKVDDVGEQEWRAEEAYLNRPVEMVSKEAERDCVLCGHPVAIGETCPGCEDHLERDRREAGR